MISKKWAFRIIGVFITLLLLMQLTLFIKDCRRNIKYTKQGTWKRCPEIQKEGVLHPECWWLAEPKE